MIYIFLYFYILQYPKSHFVYLFPLQILVDGKIISSFTRALNLENRCCNNVCKDKRFTLRQMTILDLERSYYICIYRNSHVFSNVEILNKKIDWKTKGSVGIYLKVSEGNIAIFMVDQITVKLLNKLL